jgi:hypothetical protein
MPDRVNDELISAYLDNEVTDEERAEVERALADSAETRMSFESLKQVQARMQAIPHLTLADDFHERVMREAQRRSQKQGVTAVTVRPPRVGTWIRISAIVATVAVVLMAALFIVFNSNEPKIVEQSVPDRSDRPFSPDLLQDTLPGDGVLGAGAAEDRVPQEFIMVLDLAITKRGQKEDAFGTILRQVGFSYDPRAEMQLGEELQTNLLKTRFVAGVNQPDENMVIEHFDVVDMIFLKGTGAQIGEIHPVLAAHPEIRVVLDFTMRPSTVLNSIGERSWSLAKSKSTKGLPASYAYRLNLGISLHSSRSGFLAKFPTPSIGATLVPKDEKRDGKSISDLDSLIRPNRLQPEDTIGEPSTLEAFRINEILVIRRNLKGGFPY